MTVQPSLWSWCMHRPPRRRRRVGRSIGVILFHDGTGGTRPMLMRLVTLACLVALVSLPGVAHAQSTEDRLARTRGDIDTTAQRWFDAQAQAADLDTRIAQLTDGIASMETRGATARKVARARALLMYKGASLEHASVFATSVIESARRAELIDHANAQNIDAINELTTSLDELRRQRDDLVDARARLDKALSNVASERESLDAQLATLQSQALRESHALTNVPARHLRSASAVVVRPAPPTAAATAPVSAVAPTPPVAVVAPPHGRVSPHHNDPFLVCTRAHESGGNYSVVSSGGTYYGAYQFLPSTWNATAAHAGRMELIGVLPSRASAYDQDEMAWALYQWQ